jgi:hypothetical protein
VLFKNLLRLAESKHFEYAVLGLNGLGLNFIIEIEITSQWISLLCTIV